MVLSENYQSNWSVWVDGNPAELLRANYVWKGVALPAGDHQVEFRYYSATLFWSRTVTLLCGALAAGMVASAWFARRKRAPLP